MTRRTAPYLHETTHVLVPCSRCPVWLSEGFASFVQSYISERFCGYDGAVFSDGGNRGIDREATQWACDGRGKAVLPYIGRPGQPERILADRSKVATPYYVLSQSFVKFLVRRAGLLCVRHLASTSCSAGEMAVATGRSTSRWRGEWLRSLNLTDADLPTSLPASYNAAGTGE